MMHEYDVERELEFNRVQLRTNIPKRLEELHEIIDSCNDRLEGWYASLFTKLLQHVGRVCQDLLKTTEQEALTAAAWNARNLLELWIWIKYCSASRDNARRFHEDALRDMQGFSESLSRMFELVGVCDELKASRQEKIEAAARVNLEFGSLDSNYLGVAEAARSVSLDKWYVSNNKHLSKFAHPTAGLVVGIMHQSEKLRDLQSVCTTHGVYFAGQCVIALELIILAIRTAQGR